MSAITDANFTYSVVSVPNKTLAIIGINPSNGTYSASNASWGTFPAIPAVYAGSNIAYNGAGTPANAFKVVEIGANAFDSLASFSATTLTPAFLPANLKRIGERAFAGVKLQGSLTIPETLDSVGFQAFYNTLITDIVIGSATNANIVTHLANLTSVIQQEINDRTAADASLNALKAPIDAATFTGSATIPNAVIGLANVNSASIAAANVGVANITSAQLSALTVVGNAAFTGSVLATGEWNFTVQPKINDAVVATETYVNDRFANIAGPSLATALDTLTELASAIGGDTSFATNIIQSHTSISAMLSTEMTARSNAVLALSSALSTSASSLTVVDSALSTALSGEVSARTASVAALSSTLSTNASTLQANNAAFGTALSTEVSARSSELSAASSVHIAAASSLAVVDAVLSSALSTEVSARSSAVASFAPVITSSAASLTTVDTTTVAALSTETSTRVSAVASISQLQTSAFSSLSVTTSSLSVALSTEVGARSAAVESLSASASTAAVSLQQPNTQFSIALAGEVGARVSAIESLSTSISGSVSSLVSAHSSAVSALSTETSVRTVAVSSASVSVANAVASNSSSIVVHGSAISAETSLRTSQLQSVSTVASAAVSSLSQSISGISSALTAEISTRIVAVSSAIQNILSGAPSRFNTLGKIASEMSTNQSLTITASTLSRVSALRTAVSNETSARISAVASLSNTAIPSLLAVDTGLFNALSPETSGRSSAVTSLSSALSAARVSLAAVNVVLSTALSSETSTRVSAVASVSSAVELVVSSLNAAHSSLSTALSTETLTRVSAITSLVGAGSLSFASLNVLKTATSGDIATETSARTASIVSVSGAISASFASLQTSNDAVRSQVSTLSAALAPKATTSYLDGKIATLLSGAPAQLNTLAEMAAALGNNASFASSITTALSGKATAADASSVAVAIATRGTQSQLTSLETVVSSKAPLTLLTSTNSDIVSLTNVVNALTTAVSTLQTGGGSVNGTTIAVDGVGIVTMSTRIQELYYKLGTDNPSWGLVNADGTVNYKVNPLANPTLVSSDLAFEYDANGVVTKVNHMITVQFDSDQTSARVTGGVGNTTTTINNMVLDSNNRYVFTVSYTGGLSFYEANKTEVSIVALESAYKSAPLVPTVVASAPLLPFLQLGDNNETLTYTGTAANVGSSEPLFFQANPGGTRTRSIGGGAEWFAVVKQGMKNAISGYADGTSTPFKPPGQTEPVPWTNIITTLMTDMSNLFMNKTTFNEAINTWDTRAVTTMAAMFSGASAFNRPIGPWNTIAVANMASMFSGASAFNQPISEWNTGAVTTMTAMFSGASAFNRPIGPWNTISVTNMDSMFSGASAFNQPIDTWNVTNVTPPTNFSSGSGLTAQTSSFGVAFTAPEISNSGIVTYSGNTATMTYTVATDVTQVQVRKASDNTVISTTPVSGISVLVSVTLTETISIVVVALGNEKGRESIPSAPKKLLAQYGKPVLSGNITYSGNTATMTYNVATGVTQAQVRKVSDNSVITTISVTGTTVTFDVTFSSTLQFVVVYLSNDDGRESLPSIAETLIGQYSAPTISGSVEYFDNEDITANLGNASRITYATNSGVTALEVLKSDLTALPTNVQVNTTINTTSSGRTIALSVAFPTTMSIVVISKGNANGGQSVASAPIQLVARFAKPTLVSITYSGDTATITYNLAAGVTAVSVRQSTTPTSTTMPSGATVIANTVSGNTATLQISLSGSRGSLDFVVVALANPGVGRESPVSDKQTIYSSGISDITFTKTSNLWYFNFTCNNPASVSGLTINIQWTGRVWVNGVARGDEGGTGGNWIHDYSTFTISNGANSFLITDPGYLNKMGSGHTARVSINYSVSSVSKNITTSFFSNPFGGPYAFGVTNIITTTNPVSCTLTLPNAMEQHRVRSNVSNGGGWDYYHDFVDAITHVGGVKWNLTQIHPRYNTRLLGQFNLDSYDSVVSSIPNVPIPASLWGKPLRSALTVQNSGAQYTGAYTPQLARFGTDVYTFPLPTGMYPVSVRGDNGNTTHVKTIGMSWQTAAAINDIRLWAVEWEVFQSALDVASPNYVSKVRMRLKKSTDAEWRVTGVFNYADGIGHAMFHTGVFTNQGQALGTWTIELRSENSDGTITTNYTAFTYTQGLASYDGSAFNLTYLSTKAGGYPIVYGDNVTNLF